MAPLGDGLVTEWAVILFFCFPVELAGPQNCGAVWDAERFAEEAQCRAALRERVRPYLGEIIATGRGAPFQWVAECRPVPEVAA